jgi:2',3'-cyclic-nucleotide 2'-phosphodiesterase (5'-nucleotidase family)
MADDMPDCAIVNGGGIRMTVEPGDITIGDVRNILPYLNYVCTIQVTGAQLLEAVEASLAVTPEEMGSFPQVSGVSLTIDTRVPFESAGTYPASVREKPANPGSRVTIHDVGGRGFNLDDTYTIASIDFLCAGGDTYYVFAEAAQETMKSINYLQYDCLQYYLQEACNSIVPEEYADPAGQGRIEIIE